jgi:hypothetical protein
MSLKMNCNPELEGLRKLYEETSFAGISGDKIGWSDLRIEPDLERESGLYVYVPQCSYLGNTLICLADTYEKSGVDCLFIQELIRLYSEGKLNGR